MAVFALVVADRIASAGIISTSTVEVWDNADNQDRVLGWEFSVAGTTNVSWLGYNYFGTPLAQGHTVGIYAASGSLLASAVVTNASTADNGYLWTPLASTLVLGPGHYRIAGTTLGLGDDWIYAASGIVTSPGVTYDSSWYTSGEGGLLAFPTMEAGGQQFLAANFTDEVAAIPEPTTLVLIGAGLGPLLVARRRSR